MYLTSYTSIKSISRIWVVVLRLRGTSSVTEKERASVSFLPFQKRSFEKNLTGQNGGVGFSSNSIWHFMAIDFWMGLCAKKEADIWNWNGLSNELGASKREEELFLSSTSLPFTRRSLLHTGLILRGRCIGVPSIQDQKSILTNKMKPSFSAKGQTLSNLLAKYFLLSTRDSSCRGVDAL